MANINKNVMAGTGRKVYKWAHGMQVAADETGFALAGDNGAYAHSKMAGENITLETASVSSDAVGNGIVPINSRLIAVGWYVTTSITTATTVTIGDGTTVDRFGTLSTPFTAGNTGVTLGTPWLLTAATTLRVTTSTAAGAGAIRLVPYYEKINAPTS